MVRVLRHQVRNVYVGHVSKILQSIVLQNEPAYIRKSYKKVFFIVMIIVLWSVIFEKFNPLGIHIGDFIVIAPSQTFILV